MTYNQGGWYTNTKTLAIGPHTVTAHSRTLAETSQSASQGSFEVQQCPKLSITSPVEGSKSTVTMPTISGEFPADYPNDCFGVSTTLDGNYAASGDSIIVMYGVPQYTWSWQVWSPLAGGRPQSWCARGLLR